MNGTGIDQATGQLGVTGRSWSPLLDRLDDAASAGGESEEAQRRTTDDDSVVAAIAAIEHEGVGHVRHSSTAATRSMVNLVSKALP